MLIRTIKLSTKNALSERGRNLICDLMDHYGIKGGDSGDIHFSYSFIDVLFCRTKIHFYA